MDEEISETLDISDEEFKKIRSRLYQTAVSQMERIAKRVLNIAENLAAIGVDMERTDEKILEVITKTNYLSKSPKVSDSIEKVT